MSGLRLLADDLTGALDAAVLWAGSSGLARASAEAVPTSAVPRASRVLMVTGSAHPVTRRQIAALAAAQPARVIGDDGRQPASDIAGSVAQRLASGRSAVLDAAVDGSRMRALFAALAGIPRPGLLIVAGGDTLLRLLGALGCRSIAVHGEVAARMPLSTLADGAWAGVPLISKCGAFADGGLIARLLAQAAGARP